MSAKHGHLRCCSSPIQTQTTSAYSMTWGRSCGAPGGAPSQWQAPPRSSPPPARTPPPSTRTACCTSRCRSSWLRVPQQDCRYASWNRSSRSCRKRELLRTSRPAGQ
ncbi:hypothetical protein NKG94_17320 [Micromonospora sp. M12]